MGAKEREKYEPEPGRHVKKYNSSGVSFDEMDRQKALQLKQFRIMELTIQETLQLAEERNSKNSFR